MLDVRSSEVGDRESDRRRFERQAVPSVLHSRIRGDTRMPPTIGAWLIRTVCQRAASDRLRV